MIGALRFLIPVLAYLLGSIPTAYIVAQRARGIDLRRYGSGTVSGSMVYEHVARWLVIPVGLFDMAKGALPAWLSLRLNLGLETAVISGLLAVAGHNWPIFLRFTGGRGLGTFMGVLLVIFPCGFPWLLAFLALGFALGDSAPWALISLLSMPLLARWLNAPPMIDAAIAGMALLTLLKRLEANRRPLPLPGSKRWAVIWLRLIFDRDIRDHQTWIRRKP
ncbi:MAG: glycerol-3-phosphate acyltransferase [Anaerolineales bacterium]|nr:glycerol-3-phosphate acyltransferase [Anaerolineales bacterium]